MVNNGRSNGCIACKKRKTKCDESLPSCRKCERIGKACPGYPDRSQLRFRSENGVVQRKVHVTSSTLNHVVTDAAVDSSHQALCLFFRDYVLPPSEGCCPGWLNFLPGLYQRSLENSVLQQSVLAAAYANIAQKTQKLQLSIRAASYYLRSLELVNAALSDPLGTSSDALMTSVMLLGLYECINSTFEGDLTQHHSHGLGVLADIRGSLSNECGLLQIVCCLTQRRNLDLGLMPGPEDERLLQLLGHTSMASRMVWMMYHVGRFVAEVKADSSQESQPNFLYGTILRVHELELQFQVWYNDASITMGFQKGSRAGDSTLLPLAAHDTYPDIWTASVWNKCRSLRILVHQTLLEMLDASPYSSKDDILKSKIARWNSSLVIQSMTEDIIASVPFSFGDIPHRGFTKQPASRSLGGYFLVWSLQTVYRCPFTSPEQYNRVRTMLLRIGKDFGVGYASNLVRQYR